MKNLIFAVMAATAVLTLNVKLAHSESSGGELYCWKGNIESPDQEMTVTSGGVDDFLATVVNMTELEGWNCVRTYTVLGREAPTERTKRSIRRR